MLLSALDISTSLSTDILFFLCLYPFGGTSELPYEKKSAFFLGSHSSSTESVVWPLIIQPKNSSYSKTESSTELDPDILESSCIQCCCFQKRHVLSVCWGWESDLLANLNFELTLKKVVNSVARGKQSPWGSSLSLLLLVEYFFDNFWYSKQPFKKQSLPRSPVHGNVIAKRN